MEYITSKDNKTIKLVHALTQKKYRQKYESYVVEGLRVVKDSLENVHVKIVLIKESVGNKSDIKAVVTACENLRIPVATVSDRLYETIEETVQGQGLMAIVSKPELTYSKFKAKEGFYILLDAAQDPGNLGTIIRTAVAAGCNGIFLTKGSVDPYNSKTVRSAMSGLTKIPIYENLSPEDVRHLMSEQGLTSYATTLENATSYESTDYAKKTLLILGNEGNGISDSILKQVTHRISIPIYGPIESLNLSIAAALCMYKIQEKLH